MQRSLLRSIAGCGLLAALAVVGPMAAEARAGSPNGLGARGGISGDLFYNYYVPPGYGGVGAELYLCPRPTPPLVGHTYVTYPPLLPHEFLYPHSRCYYRTNPGAGMTKTHVKWY